MRILPLLTLLLASGAWAEKPAPGLSNQKVADGLYLLLGPGGNILLEVGKDAVFLVDDEVAPVTPELKAEIAKVTPQPVRFVLNTHWHGDHTGGNAVLGEAGAVIVAHDNVRKRLSTEQFISMFGKKVPPSPPKALPVVTFTEGLSFHLNGEDIEVFHVDPAHTDGDSVVWFHKADVIHLGDVYTPAGYPFVDLSSGGHVDGFIKAADRVLQLITDKTKVVGGHGALADKAKLKTWRDMLATIRDRISKQIAAGKSLADVQAQKPTAEFDAAWGNGFIKPAVLVETLYKDLSKK
jgi:glyoxylase-like metal-dependent hydrolase (beta-lactamase superfamily II)